MRARTPSLRPALDRVRDRTDVRRVDHRAPAPGGLTGAFRRPHEPNGVFGSQLLIVARLEGFLGYSLSDALLSGTGLRRARGRPHEAKRSNAPCLKERQDRIHRSGNTHDGRPPS
ncbi:cytochrome b N-terminal domain-containing protein [Rhodococcus pyridinivorans]|uniref:cytochrome b N-terminal domain-containing protein n=1 Tax=Rhodococcus pyridinivorans TaxID=103816 RepID=UPI003AF2C533